MGKFRVILFVGFLYLPAMAQVTGRVTGSVVDPSGAAIPGARVDVMLGGSGTAIFRTNTTSDGLFTIIGVPAGEYDIVVEAAGFRKRTEREIAVKPAQETAMNALRLEVALATETIEVSSSAVAVQTTNAEVALHITKTQMQGLPGSEPEPAGVCDDAGRSQLLA